MLRAIEVDAAMWWASIIDTGKFRRPLPILHGRKSIRVLLRIYDDKTLPERERRCADH